MKKIIFLVFVIIAIGIIIIKPPKVANSISAKSTNSNITGNSDVASFAKTNSKISVIAQTNNGALKAWVRVIDYPPEQFKFIVDSSGEYATVNSNREVVTLIGKDNQIIVSTNLVKAAEGTPMAGKSVMVMRLHQKDGLLEADVGREIFYINIKDGTVDDFGQN